MPKLLCLLAVTLKLLANETCHPSGTEVSAPPPSHATLQPLAAPSATAIGPEGLLPAESREFIPFTFHPQGIPSLEQKRPEQPTPVKEDQWRLFRSVSRPAL